MARFTSLATTMREVARALSSARSALEQWQADRVRRVKRARDGAAARAALQRVRAAAESGENLMAPLVAAVKVMCTVGEIADVYREVFGQYRDPAWL